MSTASSEGGGDTNSAQQVAESLIQDIQDNFGQTNFDLENIITSVEEMGPFQNVVVQECDRMNLLIAEMTRSLVELDLGFRGELTVSDQMEELASALFLDRVPAKWEKLAYPSMRSLALWLSDLQARISQLGDWSANPGETPICTWISGLFNPQSFLTAVMQATAQRDNLELDKLTLLTDVQKKMLAEEVTSPAKEGTYIVGLSLEEVRGTCCKES